MMGRCLATSAALAQRSAADGPVPAGEPITPSRMSLASARVIGTSRRRGSAQLTDQRIAAEDLPDVRSCASQAADFIAEVARVAALGLPVLPEDPAAAAAMRAPGYEVLAECTGLSDGCAIVSVMSEAAELADRIPAGDLVAALGVPAESLPGMEFLAVLHESLEDGRVLSGFRRVPAG
jgi:hypothetical protein